MKRVLAALVVSAAFATAAVPAFAETETPALAATEPSAFRADAATIQELNRQQLTIVRRATQLCLGASLGSRASFKDLPCVQRLADDEVSRSEAPQLKAFHESIQWPDRYDQDRSAAVVQRLIED